VNILLLQLKRIGDLILTLPAVASLRENFPAAQITLAISKECADLLPAIPNINRFLLVRRNLRDLALFFGLARERFDYCIDFTRTDRSALLAFLSGARKRIVYRRRDRFQNRAARVYTDYVKVRKLAMHTIDYNLALVGPLGVRNASRALRLELPQEAREKANALRRDWKINEPYVIFHPGSARAEKFWEPQRWADVIEHARFDAQVGVVITGGDSRAEQKHLRAIQDKLGRSVVDLSGKTDLLTLATLIEGARLLVTVDSAPMHLATATQTPQVILFGPTNPFHWRPLESPALILQGESATPVTEFSSEQSGLPMRQISTAAVIDAMDLLLSPHATTTQTS
jgi:predicted lipopolysaccharide heptosyltransferase III